MASADAFLRLFWVKSAESVSLSGHFAAREAA
jgi:hypothetical protein